MSLIVGIDIGTSAATVATIKKGSLDIILNEASKRESPGLVSFYNGQRFLGEAATSLESSNAKNTVRDLKRLIGKTWSDPEAQRDIARMANKDRYRELPNDQIGVEVTHDGQAQVYDIRALLAMQLGGLKRTSEQSMRELQDTIATVGDVVLSVPNHFTDQQRRAVLDAAQIAGLNVLRLMNDAAAVALDYGMWKNARNQFDEKPVKIMFVDVGYANTWTSIVEFSKGKATVLSCTWDRELGGRDVDSALMEQFASEFQQKTKLDPRADVKAMLKLRNAAEKAKHVLTPEGLAKAEVYVEYLMNETDFRTMLHVEQLDAVVAPLVERLEPLIKRAMAEANLTPADIDGVEMIGGSSRMRHFKKAVANAMGLDSSKPPNYGVLTTLNSDESVARGCALMCAILSPTFRIASVLEVKEFVPLPIILQWEQPANSSTAQEDKEDNEESVVKGNTLGVLKRTDDIPKIRRVTFRRAEPFEIVAAYEANLEEHMIAPGAPKTIGKFKISGMPNAGSDSKGKIAVNFNHDKSGVFSVSSAEFQVEETVPSGEDGKDKKKKVIKTDLAVHSITASVDPAELQKMINLENELTAKDKALKDLADKRNELEEFIYSARAEIDDKLKTYATEEEATKLKTKLDEDEAWLYEEDGENATISQLQSRLSALHMVYGVINNRLLEVDARTASTSKMSAAIQQYLSVANSVSPDHAHITEDERKKVRAACDGALNWLTKEQEKQGKLPLNKDPILTASAIDERANMLRTECKPITEKPKPKPAPEEKKEAKQDGAKKDADATKTEEAPADAKDEPSEIPVDDKMEVEGEPNATPVDDKMEVEELD